MTGVRMRAVVVREHGDRNRMQLVAEPPRRLRHGEATTWHCF
jgi:hypothetical protein